MKNLFWYDLNFNYYQKRNFITIMLGNFFYRYTMYIFFLLFKAEIYLNLKIDY